MNGVRRARASWCHCRLIRRGRGLQAYGCTVIGMQVRMWRMQEDHEFMSNFGYMATW